MAWLWGAQKSKPEQNDESSSSKLADTPVASQSPQPPVQPLSREEQANRDLEQLLRELQIEQSTAKDERTKNGDSNTVPVPADISPDSLYPTELSCRSALDYAMFCQSFGGQFVNVYRYGSFRSCKNHWDDFWLCMRTRSWDEKDKSKAIQEHYRSKAVKWKTGPSSEDIWEVRQEPVRDAFQDSLEDLEAKIARWKQDNPDVPDPWPKQSGATFKNPNPVAQR